MNAPEIRRLVPGDEAIVDAFLTPLTASSMFLRANMRHAGLVYDGKPLEGHYAGAFHRGTLLGVVAHYWNGNLLLQAPDHAVELAEATLRLSDLPLKGIVGPWDQAQAVHAHFSIPQDSVQTLLQEVLFELPLEDLLLPKIVVDGEVRARRSVDGDIDALAEWRMQYDMEALHDLDTPENRANNRQRLQRQHKERQQFVLETGGSLIACCTFNAVLDDTVQIGGVWTPPRLRGRGYGRAVVAGALYMARDEGTAKAILFTDDDNPAAQRAYLGIGFRPIGDYGLILFSEDARGLVAG